MPRDSSGNCTLTGPNPYPAVTNTVISSSAFNTLFADQTAMFTDSLSRSGLGGMLAPFSLIDGTASAPGFSFTNETNSGLWRAGTGDVEMTVLGSTMTRWTSANFFQVSKDGGSTWLTPLFTSDVNIVLTKSTTSTGTFTTASTSFVLVTNATVTITAAGRPVIVTVCDDGSGSAGILEASCAAQVGASVQYALSANGGSTFFGVYQVATVPSATTGAFSVIVPASSVSSTFSPAAGSVTIGLYAKAVGTGSSAHVNQCKLSVLQT